MRDRQADMHVLPTPTHGPVNQALTVQARLIHKDGGGTTVVDEGNALVQADFDDITAAVYDLEIAGTAPVDEPTVQVTSVISDTLVDDEIWTEDNIGRNFLHSISGTVFTEPHLYRIIYTGTLSSALGSETITWIYEHQAIAVLPPMIYRASQDDVRNVIDSDPTISMIPFIAVAHNLTNKVRDCAIAKGTPLSVTDLHDIETYLAAHFYALRDPQYQQKQTERASATFQGKTDMGLDLTWWGQMAKVIDTSGCLDGFGKTKVGLAWLGKPKSRQLDYVERN